MINLKIERIKRKMTQKQLAEILSVTERHISRYESGNFYPTVEKLIKLADIFNVTTDYLLGR